MRVFTFSLVTQDTNKKRILAIYKQNSYRISTCNIGLTSVRLNRLFTHNTYISLPLYAHTLVLA